MISPLHLVKELLEIFKEDYSGRYLLRMSPDLHKRVAECAAKYSTSLNVFIAQTIEEKVDDLMSTTTPTYTRTVINELRIKDAREVVVVTQSPWHMQLFNQYRLCFFNTKLGKITPMQYLLCYETTKVEGGLNNPHPREIKQWGKVKEIVYNITPSEFSQIPELINLIQDQKFWPTISNWGDTNVVLLEEIGFLDVGIPIRDWRKSKYSQNKTSDLIRLRNAKYVENLYL